jgi:hypothetical protein
LPRLPGSHKQTDKARQRLSRCPASLPLLGSNQDSPDPEGAVEHSEFQQLAALYASSCHSMLEFAGLNAGLCCSLLAQMPGFAITQFPIPTPRAGQAANPNDAIRPAEGAGVPAHQCDARAVPSGPGSTVCSRYRVNNENRCNVVPSPSQMQWVRLGSSINVNGLFAATSALTNRCVAW